LRNGSIQLFDGTFGFSSCVEADEAHAFRQTGYKIKKRNQERKKERKKERREREREKRERDRKKKKERKFIPSISDSDGFVGWRRAHFHALT